MQRQQNASHGCGIIMCQALPSSSRCTRHHSLHRKPWIDRHAPGSSPSPFFCPTPPPAGVPLRAHNRAAAVLRCHPGALVIAIEGGVGERSAWGGPPGSLSSHQHVEEEEEEEERRGGSGTGVGGGETRAREQGAAAGYGALDELGRAQRHARWGSHPNHPMAASSSVCVPGTDRAAPEIEAARQGHRKSSSMLECFAWVVIRDGQTGRRARGVRVPAGVL
jgi:hypothetical protein